MITKLTGILNRVLDEEVRVQIGPFEYQILIPEFVRRQIQLNTGSEITFHILDYIEANQNSNRMIPRRIGFLSELELEFFELFCTVDKIGTKKALKAMGRPIKELADAIQRQDVKWLTTMPGIGKTSAEQIIATLRTKVAKFSMVQPTSANSGASPTGNAGGPTGINPQIFEDAYVALMTLGLSPVDARNRLDMVIASGVEIKEVADVINAVFKRSES
ncbi:MAG: helix-hairpin-helix domain-containing protein [Gemmataceae bacterium]|jgi:Holliday junction DNA helicase RuvA|nr:helix-hairpin-helix domain-containing protein [Gemmataceae bacterium]